MSKDSLASEKASNKEKKEAEFYFWIHKAFRKYVEVILDCILIGLVVVTFVLIGKTIYLLGVSLYEKTNISYIISEILFIFILIEVVRLLIMYLEFHKVAIDTMVEIAIVSTLRELFLKGVLLVEPLELTTVSLFMIVLGILLRFTIRKDSNVETFTIHKPFFDKIK
jgi:uncharacterized membrane protein (DUF373 family)